MLDTNIVPELVRRPAGDTAQQAAALELISIAISMIVAAEFCYGVEQPDSPANLKQSVLLSARFRCPNQWMHITVSFVLNLSGWAVPSGTMTS